MSDTMFSRCTLDSLNLIFDHSEPCKISSQRRRAPVTDSRGHLHGVHEFPNSTEAHTLDVTSRNLYTQSPGSGMITSSILRATEESGCLIAFWIGDTCLFYQHAQRFKPTV